MLAKCTFQKFEMSHGVRFVNHFKPSNMIASMCMPINTKRLKTRCVSSPPPNPRHCVGTNYWDFDYSLTRILSDLMPVALSANKGLASA